MKRHEKTPVATGGELLDGMLQTAMGQALTLAVQAEVEDHVARYNMSSP